MTDDPGLRLTDEECDRISQFVLLSDSLLNYQTRNRILRRMGIDPETGEFAATEESADADRR